MHCPFCKNKETKVVDSRLVDHGSQVKRRRQCMKCDGRFTTFESAELFLPFILKRNGNREQFQIDKLKKGILRSLEKRPVSTDVIEGMLADISFELRVKGEREVDSKFLGILVMDALKKIDHVAYIRFASVYLSFEDIGEFITEINKLKSY